MNRNWLDDLYVQAMRQVWQHPSNNQRSTLLERLRPFKGRFPKIVDVGAGDGYYLETLRPAKYVFVEPNPLLRRECESRAAELNLEKTPFKSIAELLETDHINSSDLVLLVHSLLYLEIEEIKELLPKLSGKSLILVYPSPRRSTTTEFEESVGDKSSREKVKIAHQLLGKPERAEEIPTQFRVPSGIDTDELAFIIGNKIFVRGLNKDIFREAKEFALGKIDEWREGDEIIIPQNQMIEYYSRKLREISPAKKDNRASEQEQPR